MNLHIRLLEPPLAAGAVPYSTDSSALDLAAADATVLLRFVIETAGQEELEALCHARRSMLREEWTLGHDGEAPALGEAFFSTAEISWRVRPEQRHWCLQKVEELATRANRFLAGHQKV